MRTSLRLLATSALAAAVFSAAMPADPPDSGGGFLGGFDFNGNGGSGFLGGLYFNHDHNGQQQQQNGSGGLFGALFGSGGGQA
ncbi:hypothetical protein SMC26_25340 [Actinomadura fulvescens]|uniref:BA14K family protein n=1 Tax=Actinomadura fulvescens TaxID=46160 RepID=A0ABP6CD68_9ACTN